MGELRQKILSGIPAALGHAVIFISLTAVVILGTIAASTNKKSSWLKVSTSLEVMDRLTELNAQLEHINNRLSSMEEKVSSIDETVEEKVTNQQNMD